MPHHFHRVCPIALVTWNFYTRTSSCCIRLLLFCSFCKFRRTPDGRVNAMIALGLCCSRWQSSSVSSQIFEKHHSCRPGNARRDQKNPGYAALRDIPPHHNACEQRGIALHVFLLPIAIPDIGKSMNPTRQDTLCND